MWFEFNDNGKTAAGKSTVATVTGAAAVSFADDNDAVTMSSVAGSHTVIELKSQTNTLIDKK